MRSYSTTYARAAHQRISHCHRGLTSLLAVWLFGGGGGLHHQVDGQLRVPRDMIPAS